MKLDAKVEGSEAVRRMLQRLGTQLSARALAATAEDVEEYVGHEAGQHTRTGALFRSVYKRRISDGWEMGHDLQVAPQALFVHWGTKPHVIRPRRKKALRWPAGDKFAFAKAVHHPGYKGDPWLVRAAALAPQIFERQVAAALARIEQEN